MFESILLSRRKTISERFLQNKFFENDYFDQYRDLNLFSKKYVGEELMNQFITYLVMKSFYAIQVIDLRFQVDHITPKEIKLFEKYRVDPTQARVFVSLITHTESKTVSDVNEITELNFLKLKMFNWKDFMKK